MTTAAVLMGAAIVTLGSMGASAQAQGEQTQTHASWTVRSALDSTGDSKFVIASTENDDARLSLVCRDEASLELRVTFRFIISSSSRSEQRRASYRVDNNAPIMQTAHVGFDDGYSRLQWTLGRDSGLEQLIEQALGGDRLVFRTFDVHRGGAHIATVATRTLTKEFSLAGFETAAARVLERCG